MFFNLHIRSAYGTFGQVISLEFRIEVQSISLFRQTGLQEMRELYTFYV
jgi:hypothetical protein